MTAEAFDYLDAPPTRVHQVDAPLAYAANLEALALPSVDKIVEAVKAVTCMSKSVWHSTLFLPVKALTYIWMCQLALRMQP